MAKPPRAIDLYSGVGGWSLGLRLSGIEVVSSYERWGAANETNFKNNAHLAQTVDIRRLSLHDLPKNIDIVVGSPPCTEFSFSNKGGGGDIADGLKDVVRFLEIVDHIKPRVWVMENVPRVKKIIEAELKPGGVLSDFRHLGCEAHIIDMAEYGVPQRRRRCIAGNLNLELLKSYRVKAVGRTLGDVIEALDADPIVDPLFGFQIEREDLTDHVEEDVLSEEEVRINRANKVTHTVYNAMPFPDRLDRPVRTITATCTRVSRESIIIPVTRSLGAYRRLTLRERACLQGFPMTFQFYGANYGQKLRMIGNAVPPAFSYLVGHALQEHRVELVPRLSETASRLARAIPPPVETLPDRVGTKYPADRRFRFAVPSLQLKSGVRFELRNDHFEGNVKWCVAFYFGTSKAIQSIELDACLASDLHMAMSPRLRAIVANHLQDVAEYVVAADIVNMQVLWAHQGPGGTRAFMLLDKLDQFGSVLSDAIREWDEEACRLIDVAIQRKFGQTKGVVGIAKLHRNAAVILAGLLIGSSVNPLMDAKRMPRRQSGRARSA